MKALTAAEMRAVDRLTTERFRVSGLELMERAGKHVAEAVLRRFAKSRPRVAVLCGMGNNGGDGFVAARHLKSAGLEPQIFLFGQPDTVTGDAGKNLKQYRDAGGSIVTVDSEPAWE